MLYYLYGKNNGVFASYYNLKIFIPLISFNFYLLDATIDRKLHFSNNILDFGSGSSINDKK